VPKKEMNLLQKVGQRIKVIRTERGITQVDLAKELRTTQSAITRIEHGQQNLTLLTLERVCKKIGCQPVDLL